MIARAAASTVVGSLRNLMAELRTDNLIHPLAAPFRFDGTRGEALVLVHGFTGNPAHLRVLGSRLAAEGYTVMAPLLPGHGRSIEALTRVRRSDWIEATVDAIREVGDHHSVHLVGLSMGGLLSIIAALRATVATVTTINSPVVFRDRRLAFAWLARPVITERRWPEEAPPDLDPEVAPYWIHASGFPIVAAAELHALAGQALRAARQVEVPSLVIQSKIDDTTHPKSGPRLRDALAPNSRLLWLEHSMHNALFDSERGVIADQVLEMVAR
jgi:carboxylesterase